MAGLTALFACVPVVHVAIGIAVVTGSIHGTAKGPPVPQAMGWQFIAAGTAFILLGWAYAIARALAAMCSFAGDFLWTFP